ncbi:MAG: hypothetical protein IBJ10_04260 [Phycisphaerales bacterium]|nr:hypothetical protein [Phycisphaerales bacterium]
MRLHLTERLARAILAFVVFLGAAPAALAQTGGAPVTFFMIINGRVTGNASFSPRVGDRVAAVIEGGGTVEDQVDATGEWEGLTITRSTNDQAVIKFEYRRGSSRWLLVPAAGATDQATTTFAGNTNPLSAAFNAQNQSLHIGPAITGGNGNGDGDGDGGGSQGGSPDVDGDGVVTMEDARLVMRWIIGFRRDLEGQALDVTADGRVNTQDVTEILRRMGETVEPGADDDETEQ